MFTIKWIKLLRTFKQSCVNSCKLKFFDPPLGARPMLICTTFSLSSTATLRPPIVWMHEWLHGQLYGWLHEWLHEWLHGQLYGWLHEWLQGGCMNGCMGGCMNGCMGSCMNGWMGCMGATFSLSSTAPLRPPIVWMHEWLHGQLHEWLHEQLHGHV